MSTIPPAERRELRAVVRAQFKVLRAEVEQRKAELQAEAEGQLVHRYRDEDKQMEDLNWRISEIARQAGNDIEDAMKAAGLEQEGGYYRMASRFSVPTVKRKNEDRAQLHRALLSGIDAQVQSAKLSLDRQEADLLKQLAMDGLESEAAQAFLTRIPSVGELVPGTRLREIESAFDRQKDGA